MQEDNAVFALGCRDLVIFHALDFAFERRHFMIMGGKKRFATYALGNIFRNGGGNGKTVERRSSPADLVHDDEAVCGRIVQYFRNFDHLDHESALSVRKVIARAYTREYPVCKCNIRLCCGHIRTQMRHQCYQRNLPHICAFTRHIRTGNDHHSVLSAIEIGVIGHEFVFLHQQFDDGMPAALYRRAQIFRDSRLDIIIFLRRLGKRKQYV